MDKKDRKVKPYANALGEKSKNLQLFEKQLANLRRFSGTKLDANHLIKRRLNDPNNKKVIFAASKNELYKKAYYQETWEKANALPLSARQFLDAISITILYLYLENFSLQYRDGIPFSVPEVDSLLGNDSARCRIISTYLEADKSGMKPRRIMSKVELLKLIDLVARTYHLVK